MKAQLFDTTDKQEGILKKKQVAVALITLGLLGFATTWLVFRNSEIAAILMPIFLALPIIGVIMFVVFQQKLLKIRGSFIDFKEDDRILIQSRDDGMVIDKVEDIAQMEISDDLIEIYDNKGESITIHLEDFATETEKEQIKKQFKEIQVEHLSEEVETV